MQYRSQTGELMTRPRLFRGEFLLCSPREACDGLGAQDQIELCRCIAADLKNLWHLETAEAFLCYGLDLAQRQARSLLPELHVELGRVLVRKCSWPEAEVHYDRAWTLSREVCISDEARLLNGWGCLKLETGEWNAAETLFRRASNLENETPGRLQAVVNARILHNVRGFPDEVLKGLDSLVGSLRDVESDTGYCYLLSHVLGAHLQRGDYDQFETILAELQDLLLCPGLELVKCDVWDSLALFHLTRGDLDRASAVLDDWRPILANGVGRPFRGYWTLRHARWLRLSNQAPLAVGELRQAIGDATIPKLVRAALLHELALAECAAHNPARGRRTERMALRCYERLGCAQLHFDRLAREFSAAVDITRALSKGNTSEAFIGGSASAVATRDIVQKVAKTTTTVYLSGESGTGKTLLARVIHNASERRLCPFVRFDCTCTSESLVDSFLFGHVRGAFTGAVSARAGLIEGAEGGTLFLDEIGDLELPLQGKLLTLIDERVYRPVGATHVVTADVRIIVATNRDLEVEVTNGRFRRDLLYRLGMMKIDLVPLRHRREDIVKLADHVLGALCGKYGMKKVISGESMKRLQEYDWPGNVRELRHCLERAYVMGTGRAIAVEDLGLGAGRVDDGPELTLGAVEREHIIRVLGMTGGNRSKAARILGLRRTTLYSRMERLGLGECKDCTL